MLIKITYMTKDGRREIVTDSPDTAHDIIYGYLEVSDFVEYWGIDAYEKEFPWLQRQFYKKWLS